MSNDEFRRRISEVAIDMDDAALDAAIGYHVHSGKIGKRYVADCIEMAGYLTGGLMKDGNKEDDPVLIEFDDAASLSSSMLQRMIAPGVEDMRLKLFDAVTPPFASRKDAADWLAALPGGEQREPSEVERARRIYDEWQADPRRTEFEEAMGVEVDITLRAHLIPYIDPDTRWVVNKPVDRDSPYVALESVAKRLADSTGFNEAGVVMHILCDTPLILPSIRITQTRRFGGRMSTVRAEFNSPDITHAQITKVLKLVRESWGKSDRRRTNAGDISFLKIIETLGGVPESERVRFFERVRESCMDEGIGSYEKSGWRGPYRRWKRLMEREPNLAPVGTKEN